MTPIEQALTLARKHCVCTCYAPNAAPYDSRGPLRDGSHFSNCPVEIIPELAEDIADAIRSAERAARAHECERCAGAMQNKMREAAERSAQEGWQNAEAHRRRAERAEAAAAAMRERIAALFPAIAHGDEAHRTWLRVAIEQHFAALPRDP